MPAGSSSKRERQYERIKERVRKGGESAGESVRKSGEFVGESVRKGGESAGESVRRGGESVGRAAETAARTVDEAGARISTGGTGSSSRRGGQRSHGGAEGPTRDQLYEEARKKDIEGRSYMNKEELRRAVGR